MANETEIKWIDWNGGSCPVDLNALVEVELRDGYVDVDVAGDWAGSDEIETPENSNWMHNGSRLDIVRYRVVSA